jgi:deoxyribodipyrimidine photo-lyase
MRQLATTGWMHNRVRMVVASFLVKDLLVDWRIGERWFRHLLVDGDVAQNVGNWQWVAGTGPDAAPYFRVFNPVVQSRNLTLTGPTSRRSYPSWPQCPHRGSTHPGPPLPWSWPPQASRSVSPTPIRSSTTASPGTGPSRLHGGHESLTGTGRGAGPSHPWYVGVSESDKGGGRHGV